MREYHGKGGNTMTSSNNPVAHALKIIAYLTYACGLFLGLIIARESVEVGYFSRVETVFSWTTALLIWSSALISGTLILGFAELIKLSQLQADLADSTNMAIRNLRSNQTSNIANTSNSTTKTPLAKATQSQSRKTTGASGEFDLNKWKNNNI